MALAVMTILAGCSTTKTVETPVVNQEPQNKSISNNIAVESDATYYTELNFKKGSSKLKDENYSALDDLVKKSMQSGTVDEIKIITWADQEYPNKKNKSLSDTQKKLADHRNERIKNYLKKTYPTLDITVYNMAKRPNVLQELFNTSDAKTKKSIESAGITFDKEHRVNYAKKESTSLVLSIIK